MAWPLDPRMTLQTGGELHVGIMIPSVSRSMAPPGRCPSTPLTKPSQCPSTFRVFDPSKLRSFEQSARLADPSGTNPDMPKTLSRTTGHWREMAKHGPATGVGGGRGRLWDVFNVCGC